MKDPSAANTTLFFTAILWVAIVCYWIWQGLVSLWNWMF